MNFIMKEEPIFIWAFKAYLYRSHPEQSEISDLLENPMNWSSIHSVIAQYDTNTLLSLIQGWYVQCIIDGFVNRWAGTIDPNGKINDEALYIRTEQLSLEC